MESKDLFGQVVHPVPKPSKLEKALQKYDRDSFLDRLSRLKVINTVWPKDIYVAGDMEFVYAIGEIKMCYIDGQFLATIILTQAVIEKVFFNLFVGKDLKAEAKEGLNNMIQFAKGKDIIHDSILEMIDKLRIIRNPIIHYKECVNPQGLSLRAFQERSQPYELLEKDAEEGIRVLGYIISHIGLLTINRV
jgi:hypothetical protein